MSLLLSLIGGSWQGLLAIAAVVGAFIGTWFGGKQVGKSQQRARAQVAEAKKSAAQIEAVANKQADNSEEAKRVQTSNIVLNDADARSKLQQSEFNTDDSK
ncbi:hypothetical protein [Erwinia sorbitola]|uniref:DUF2681 domain-containing protein n=1 Tax=Erwinia sorbitola TaxID=2681984 RepID=A0A6I6F231_9GAMM|nr:hypothetical protein [Erwinia sorbitola]MTD25462.1 hypothetical protein [Erwinia sorbitola]QGU87970.1 hypothetical protein GN242_12365 [Erwinia sorbitola]